LLSAVFSITYRKDFLGQVKKWEQGHKKTPVLNIPGLKMGRV